MPYLSSSLKTILLFLLILYLSNNLFAQSNFYKFTAGAGYGLTLTFPDTKSLVSSAGYASLDYNLTPYMTLGSELQKGHLNGGNKSYGFTNSYTTVTMNGKVHAGQFMLRKDLNNFFLNSIRGLYVGAGVGIIKNNVTKFKAGFQDYPLTEKNKDVVFPFNIGINFYFLNHWGYSRFILNLNIQSSTFLGDKMDGDLNPSSNFNDIYNFYTLGLKYNFGPLGLDKRR